MLSYPTLQHLYYKKKKNKRRVQYVEVKPLRGTHYAAFLKPNQQSTEFISGKLQKEWLSDLYLFYLQT